MKSPGCIDSLPPRVPIAVCFGGGGGYAYGFNMGVAEGLLDAGIDIGAWPMIGTSAGSHAVASLAHRHRFDDLAPEWSALGQTITRPFWIRASDLSEACYAGDPLGGPYGGVAVRMLTYRRRILWADEVSAVDYTAASSTVFPAARPHKIDGRRYIDGGFRSAASADLAPAADLLLLMTAFADPRQGILGRAGRWQARREIPKWERRHGGRVIHVGPTDAMTEIQMRGIRALGDIEIGRAVYELARPLGRSLADRLRADHAGLLAACDKMA